MARIRRRFGVSWRAAAAVSMAGLAGLVPLSAASKPADALSLSLPVLAPTSPYIVSDSGSSTSSLAQAVVATVSGTVEETLDAASGVLAELTPLQVTLLQAMPNVTVTPDVTVSVFDATSKTTSSAGTTASSTVSAATSAPATRAPAAVYPEQSGATQLWSAGDSGAGVNVAVLDTGIDNLPDLAGRLLPGVDLSGGNNAEDDAYGHGTFVAGLIAGDGASSKGLYEGEAPGSDLIPIKVAGATGATDLATVIEGVGWAISHKTADHIGVLNMSLGYVPVASTVIDPLDQAVERAWDDGIVVVVAAGNYGPYNGTILSPGDDPKVITVGAVDDEGSDSTAGDTMTTFSSVGPTTPDGWFKPDLVTSGRSVVSLMAPGSTVAEQNPNAQVGSGNFVGSGTSFSAAITSGAVALLLSDHPGLTPDQVKATLLGTTSPGPVGNPFVDGHGLLNVAAASASAGSLQLTQTSGAFPVSMSGTSVSLSNTWADSAWDPANWNTLPPSARALAGSAWSGSAWSGSAWSGSAWSGSAWSGSAWSGSAWSGSAWSGSAWSGSAWSGSAWSGSAWSGSAWSGSGWGSPGPGGDSISTAPTTTG